MGQIAKDMTDAARRDNRKILFWHVNKLKRKNQSRLVPIKNRNGDKISNKKNVKKRDGQNILKLFQIVMKLRNMTKKRMKIL